MTRSWWFGGSLWRRAGLLCGLLVACAAVAGSAAASAQAVSDSWSAVSAGSYHTCGLRIDGSIVCWGAGSPERPSGSYPDEGQATPPTGTNFTAVSAGGTHTCAVKTDGSIVCWGYKLDGGRSSPAGHDFTAVSAGWNHSCGLKTDGSIYCWGNGYYGQTKPPAENDFTAVSAGLFHTCALRSDGSVACWGAGSPGKPSGYPNEGQATPPSGNDFTAVSAGGNHTCALKRDGSIACWGDSGGPPGNDFTAVSAGAYQTCALKTDGSIACWAGWGVDTGSPAGNDFTAVSTGGNHTCALKTDGSIACWGDNDYNQTAVPPDQTIGISRPPAHPVAGGLYEVVAWATSGLPVRLSIDSSSTPGACSVSGDMVSFTGRGSCVIDANQAGDATYNPAPQVSQTMTIRTAPISTSPTSGPAAGGTQVIIHGSGFVAGEKAVIGQGHGPGTGAITATAVSVDSSTQITATTGGPAKAGTWNLYVIGSGGAIAAGPSFFTYTPLVTSVSPDSGPAAGGTHITILGRGFLPGDTVVIGQGQGAGAGAITATAVSVDSSTQISATTGGPAKAGTWNLYVIGSDGSISTSRSFTYTRSPTTPP